MTSEVDERLRLVMGDYGCYRSQWVKDVKARFSITAPRIFALHCTCRLPLKGLGHAILGNFCTYQIVIELTKIPKERPKTIEGL